MNYRRKALGLSLLAALGLMAFTAAGAQASGQWLVGGVTLTAGLAGGSLEISGEQEGTGNLLLILNLNLILECAIVEVKGAKILAGGTGHGKLHFLKCHALDHKGGKAACTFAEPIVANVKALALLHPVPGAGEPYILFSPLDLLTFATVKAEGPECPLPESATVKGSVLAKVTVNNANPALITTKGTLGLLGHELKYGANVAHLSADAKVFITSVSHLGKTLGVH